MASIITTTVFYTTFIDRIANELKFDLLQLTTCYLNEICSKFDFDS